MDTAKRSNDLNLYFVLFSVHKDKEWSAHAGYVFAYDRDSLQLLLNRKYGSAVVRSAATVTIEEGTILYGERWVQL